MRRAPADFSRTKQNARNLVRRLVQPFVYLCLSRVKMPRFDELPAKDRAELAYAEYKRLAEHPDAFVDGRLRRDACVLQYAAAVADLREAELRKSLKG